jgi:hypothetical protein
MGLVDARSPEQERRRSPPRGLALRLLPLTAVLVVLGFLTGTTNAAFDAAAHSPGSSFAAGYWGYASKVLADGPSFWWRLGEPGPGEPLVFTDDFEGTFAWTTYNSGTVASSSAQAHAGAHSLLKDNNNDPSGGWSALGFTSGNDWTFEIWLYRPSSYSGGASDRVAVENASFSGYGLQVNHSGNSLAIERRSGGSGSNVASASFNPPENQWYRVTLTRSGSSLTAAAYSSGGSLLSSVSGSDSSYGSVDRFVVHGGYEYFVDDVTVTASGASPTTVATDTMGTMDGTYTGSPALGQPSLVSGESDTSVLFDGGNWVALGDSDLLNIGARRWRSAELWFRADTTSGRQVLYEEGGSSNGMVIYLDGSSLRARAWANAWSNDLDTIATITAGQVYFVVVTLDAETSPNLILYLDGYAVDSASKPDTKDWSAHSDNGGIAAQNGSTKYHDGSNSGSGDCGFHGVIDDVSIYNSALSADRVLLHWLAGMP